MVNVNLILVIVGGFRFLGANRKSLNTLLLITYDLFLMKITNLMLVIVGGDSRFLISWCKSQIAIGVIVDNVRSFFNENRKCNVGNCW